jgi:hypothetical protein
MEEVKRVTTKKKANIGTIILIALAAVLGLGLIGAAVYFYALEGPEDPSTQTDLTCGCYYIDPAVVSECGDPRRGFLFETNTVSGDQVCRAGCSTNKLSVNLLNSNTRQELYQICQLQTVSDVRCSEMVVKDKNGKIVTGKVPSDDELNIEATFDQEYSDYKLIINNQDFNPDQISADGITIQKKIKELDANTITIAAVATAPNGEQVGSPICRRLIEVDREGLSDVSDIQADTREVEGIDKVSRIRIGVGNVTEEDNLTLRFSFNQDDLIDLIMNEGFTIDPPRGEITIIEQDLYDPENFGTDTTFEQLNDKGGKIEITVEVRSDTQIIGSATGAFEVNNADETDDDTDPTQVEESSFAVTKTSNKECVERVSPNNIAQFTLTISNGSSILQKVNSIKDKLPLGFTYVDNSSRINSQSVNDEGLVSITNVGNTQEIIWQKEGGWDVQPSEVLTMEFQSEVGENALSGQNQNEVVISPEEVPADPTTLRAEYVILVAQDCSDPNAVPEPEPEDPIDDDDPTDDDDPAVEDPDTPTTPETGIFDSTTGKLIVGIIILIIGWYIYSRPLGQTMVEKLIQTNMFKEVEINSWRIFNPKKYFESKVVKNITKKKEKKK